MSILRATFGRLSITKSSLGRITIGHIQIEGTALEDIARRRRRRNSKTGTNKQTVPKHGVKFRDLNSIYRKQRLREDNELLELVIAYIG